MALSVAHLGDRTQGGGATAPVTLSRALAAGELGLCAVLNTKATTPDTPTVSGGGVTWVQVTTSLITATVRLTIFRAQGSSPSGTTVTADFAAVSQSGTLVIVDAWAGVRPDIANNGAACIVQTVAGTAVASADYTVTGAALASPNNAQWTPFGITGGQNVPTAQDGATLLNAVTKGSPANAMGTTYEVGDNHARVTLTSSTIQGILLEISQQAALVLGGTVTPVGTLGSFTSRVRSLSGTITPTGTLAKLSKRFLAGRITPVGSLLAGRLLQKFLAGTITPVGTLTRAVAKTYYAVLAGTISPSGTLVARFLGIHYVALSGMIAPIGSLARDFIHRLLSPHDPRTETLTPLPEATKTLTPEAEATETLTPFNERLG